MSLDAARLAAVISPLRRALLAAAREREKLPDIPDAQIEVIRALPRGTVSSPGRLAHRLGLGRSTISNLLASMERAGLVARRNRDDDRRHVEVVALSTALDYFDRFDRAAAAIVADVSASLSREHLAALEAAVPALEQLRDALVARRDTTDQQGAAMIATPAVPSLEAAFDVTVRLGAMEDYGTTSAGHRRIIPIVGGEISGDISAEILPGGADWQLVRADGTIEIDGRYSARTPENELLYLRVHGLRGEHPGAALPGKSPAPPETYFRTTVSIETSAPGLAQLQRSLFIASCIRDAAAVRYTAYRVT